MNTASCDLDVLLMNSKAAQRFKSQPRLLSLPNDGDAPDVPHLSAPPNAHGSRIVTIHHENEKKKEEEEDDDDAPSLRGASKALRCEPYATATTFTQEHNMLKSVFERHVHNTVIRDIQERSPSQKQAILDAYTCHLTNVLEKEWSTWFSHHIFSETSFDEIGSLAVHTRETDVQVLCEF